MPSNISINKVIEDIKRQYININTTLEQIIFTLHKIILRKNHQHLLS